MVPDLAPPRPVWLDEAEIARIVERIGDIRFVGGCVRDLLLGRAVADLDLATPLPPAAVMALMRDAGVRVIPTGIDHGTVTVMAGVRPLEVTTLRRDVSTDGRHAVVAYTDDWAEDAARRDFTMNALFMAADGAITDTVGGLDDLRAGRVRFIGDPARRIDEDLLRILRFYRFQAGYGRVAASKEARAACAARAGDLGRLSPERIQTEMLKLLSLPDPTPTLRIMAEDGVLPAVLQGVPDLAALDRLQALSQGPDPLRRLAILATAGPAALGERLRLSAAQIRRLDRMSQPLDLQVAPTARRALLHRCGADEITDRVLYTAARTAASGAAVDGFLAEAQAFRPLPFPLGGSDLLAIGLKPGPAIGALLREVEAWWLAEDRRPDRDACLEVLRRRTRPA